MSTTAQTWVEAAYLRSAANDPGKLAQDAELVDHANRIYQRFYALFAKARPDEAASTLSLVLAGNPAFVALPADVIAIVSVKNALGAQVHLIPANETQRLWHMAPCVSRIGNTLTSRSLGGDPLAGATLTVIQLDAPTPIVTLTDVIDVRFPTRHHQLCIDSLALYLDTKDDGRSQEEHGKIVGEYQTALSTFASEYDLPPSALEWAHAPVDRSPVSAS
jgi:hypothetical protein